MLQRAMEGHKGGATEGIYKELYNAAREGIVTALKKLHDDRNIILSELTPDRKTALHIAASRNLSDFIKELIHMCKEINMNEENTVAQFLRAQNVDGDTALHEACSAGSYDVVRALLQADDDARTSLDPENLPESSREENALARIRNGKSETAVFKAAENGHCSIVKLLLKNNVTPDNCLRRWDGQTPLHLAIRSSKEAVVDLLLREKPHLATEIDKLERTPLHIASSADFSRYGGKWKWAGDDISIQLIKANRQACSAKDKKGETPLHIAVKQGNSGLTEKILKYEPSCMEEVDGNSGNALHLAVEYATEIYGRSPHDLQRIMASVTDPTFVNRTDVRGRTPLAIAIKKGDEDPQLYTAIRDYLLRRGASPQETKTANDEAKTHSHTHDLSTAEPITVNISLIATVAFAVAFTLPKADHSIFFYVLVISDTMAFCYSLGVALLLVYVRGNPHFSISAYISAYVFAAISVAGASLALAFGAAVHLVVAPTHLWLAVIVWVMVLTVIYLGITKSQSKLFLFDGKWKQVLLIIAYPAEIIAVNLLAPVFSILDWVVVSCGASYATRRKFRRFFNVQFV